MKHGWVGIMAVLLVAGVFAALAGGEYDVAKYHGKTGLKAMTEQMDAGQVCTTTASVTNGEAVTLSKLVTVLTGIGGADNTTNTITLSVSADRMHILIVDPASTNLIKVADDGTYRALAGDWIADNGDSLTIVTTSTNATEISRSNN